MRTELFFDDVDASSDITSSVFEPPCQQDMRFLIQVTGSGITGGVPKLYIEESVDGTVWTSMINPSNCNTYFDVTDLPVGIKDSYFMGHSMRLRLEANGATGGTIWAKMLYKSKV